MTSTQIDHFALLGHFSAGRDRYARAGDAVTRAALAVAAAVLRTSDLATLVAARDEIGPDLDAVVEAMKPAEATSLARRLDPHAPPVAEGMARERVVALLGGAPTTPMVAARDVIGVAGLREARSRLDGSFGHWLGSLNPSTLNTLLRAVDPHMPHARTATDGEARERVTAIAEGADPSVAFDTRGMDLAGLRAARDALGTGLKGRIEALPIVKRRKLLKTLDPHLPGLGDLPEWSVTPRLLGLADGTEPRKGPDIGSVNLSALEG